MVDTWMKNSLVVFVILLFICAAASPSVNQNVVKASNDNDLVEVTTQACGIKGYRDTTVKLTKQQYQNLEQYLVEFRARLNQTSTREEAVPIFKEAVVELNKYGLLPKGMNVERAQKLVLGPYQNIKLLKGLEKLSTKLENSSFPGGNKNCLIYGETRNNTCFQGLISRIIYEGLFLLYASIIYFSPILLGLVIVSALKTLALSLILRNFPYIGATIYHGIQGWGGSVPGVPPPPPHYEPTEGSIWTNGAYGEMQWNGQIYGYLTLFSAPLIGLFMAFFPAVNGFIGLRLNSNNTDYYFGFAFNVAIGSTP